MTLPSSWKADLYVHGKHKDCSQWTARDADRVHAAFVRAEKALPDSAYHSRLPRNDRLLNPPPKRRPDDGMNAYGLERK